MSNSTALKGQFTHFSTEFSITETRKIAFPAEKACERRNRKELLKRQKCKMNLPEKSDSSNELHCIAENFEM